MKDREKVRRETKTKMKKDRHEDVDLEALRAQ